MSARSFMGTALVTSAAGAIGRAIATALAPRWAIVVQESPPFSAEAEELARGLRATGGSAVVVVADFDDVAATGTILERAAAAQGPVTLLVNAASLFGVDRGGFDTESWTRLFAVNLRAPWQLATDFAATLPAEASGAIVNILDRRLWQTPPGARLYELSQAALVAATETMARAYAPRIRVNAVGPAQTIATALSIDARSDMPLGASAPDAIARAVVYLANAVNVTGQVIAIDPGENFSHAGAR